MVAAETSLIPTKNSIMSHPITPTVDTNVSASHPFALGSSRDAEQTGFVERRGSQGRTGGGERRQFGSSHSGLSEAGRELALAIDQYKIENHRRYITCDEMLMVLSKLGYLKVDA